MRQPSPRHRRFIPAWSYVVWGVAACNAGGCSGEQLEGVLVQPPVSGNDYTSFSVIEPAFRAPSCVNCHAVVPTGFQNQNAESYETPGSDAFGLPPAHPAVTATSECVSCHADNQMPEGSHPVPWQVPAGLDFRNKTSAELCDMAKNTGGVAENVADHLLGDPLILWAVIGGPLPSNAGNTDVAFEGDWQVAVQNWVIDGMNCN